MNELRRVLREVLQPINRSAISIMGVFTILWGIWVAAPMWKAFESADAFEIMQRLAPEWAWGVLAIGVGVAIMYGVITRTYHSLTSGALSGFLYWTTVDLFFWLGDWQNTAGIIYLMVAVYCGFIWLNLRINREHFDKNV